MTLRLVPSASDVHALETLMAIRARLERATGLIQGGHVEAGLAVLLTLVETLPAPEARHHRAAAEN